jgi:PKD repeat protein
MKSKIESMKFLGCCIFLLLTAASLSSNGQSLQGPTKICATMEQDSINRIRYPQLGTPEEFEEAIQNKLREMRLRGAAARTKAGVVSLPIIVHIVHNGEPVGTGANLSQAQVQAQIEVLNEDFRRKPGTPGYNTSPIGADVEIEFCLSPVDENGNTMTEPGIDRFNGNRVDWSRDQIENQLKPTTIWNPNLFYNIWTVKFNAGEGGLLGYAQFPDQTGLQGIPSNSPASTDGVVVRYNNFGSADKGNFPVMQAPYNKGRTLTHETGHWFGLRHIWGDGVCGDDFVADTPTQRSASSGCPNSLSCNDVTPAMVQNYMDYSNDACMNIFTMGQKDRMLAALETSPRRKSLMQANLCSPPVADVPTANFTADKAQCVLLGSVVEFTDLSTNFPTEWIWDFEGGDPNISNDRNPKVTYNFPGTFKVTLIAKNSLGSSAPFTIEDYITVSEEGLCNELTNFEEGYTPSVLKLSQFGPYTGYLTGNNSAKSEGFSELFDNSCGYNYISGVKIRFGKIKMVNEDAKLSVVVWSARGAQGGPNPVIERKEVFYKRIQEDVDNNEATTITFDRLTPVFSRPFHVGIELDTTRLDAGDSIAITSSAHGEATKATSWVKDASGQWQLFTIAYGANIAMDIEPMVGAKPSVQVSATKTLIYPGEEVRLNGQGASIFVWNADDGSIVDFAGPQLVVYPTKQTTYITEGSGLDLCTTTAYTTIYIRSDVVGVEEPSPASGISLVPNPGTALNVVIDNDYSGEVSIGMNSSLGTDAITPVSALKMEKSIKIPIETSNLRPGIYMVVVRMGNSLTYKKWLKI